MKKKVLLASLLVLPLLAACTSITFKPKRSYPGDPVEEEEKAEFNMTVNFYLDFSHSEAFKEDSPIVDASDYEPIFTMRWYMLTPIGECPQEAILTSADAADPLYTKFLGYSEFSSSLDESKLWNFATDYKQSNILNLYGIWVSDAE